MPSEHCWCGKPAFLNSYPKWYVYCSNCGRQGASTDTKEMAITLWNNDRVSVPAVPVGKEDTVLRLCRLALMSLPVEALGRDELFGHFYRDELLSEVNRVLNATPAPKPEGKCVKCGHDAASKKSERSYCQEWVHYGHSNDPDDYDKQCGCKCEFSVPTASEEESNDAT